MGATTEQPTNLELVNDLRDYANKWETAKGRELMNKAALRIEALALRNELNEREIAALASHAPSDETICPQCGWDTLTRSWQGKPQEAAAQPDGYCSKAPTAPHPQYKDCVDWTPEIEHNDH